MAKMPYQSDGPTPLGSPSISPMGGIDVYGPCSEAIGGVEHSSKGYVPGPSGKEKTLLKNISQDVKNNVA